MFSVLPTPMHNSKGQNVPNSRVQGCSLNISRATLAKFCVLLVTLSLVVCGLDTAPAYGGTLATVSS